jgi:F-box/WD-40 domain protein MET30
MFTLSAQRWNEIGAVVDIPCAVRTLRGYSDRVTCLQFSETLQHPSFHMLITCDRAVRVWDIETGFEVCCLRGHMRAVRAL